MAENEKDLLAAMQDVYAQADCLYTFEQVNAAITRMAAQISHDLAAENIVVLVVMNGGLIFAGQLLSQLHFPLQLDYLHASRYGNEIQGDRLKWRIKPAMSLVNRQVLIVDDILDEGHTLMEIRNYCLSQGATRVNTAVLVEKNHTRKVHAEIKADYCELTVADRFVFGYGMDYQSYWRNAPGIFAVKGL